MHDDAVVYAAATDAWALRVQVGRALARGEGNEAHPALVRFRLATGGLGRRWGHADERCGAESRDGRGDGHSRAPDDRASPSAEAGDGRFLRAARRLATVVEEGDRDGRLAVLARIKAVRRSLGWDGADALGRDVVDQYALAVVHAEVLRACVDALNAWTARVDEDGQEIRGEGISQEAGWDAASQQAQSVWEAYRQLAEVVGPSPSTGDDEDRDDRGALRRAWKRRLERAERGLRNAARLVRHARKAGWLPRESGLPTRLNAGGRHPGGGSSSGDPLAPLAAPLPPPSPRPLRGEAAEVAAETRARIDAMREAWPPPHRIRQEALDAPHCPWNPFDYLVECDPEGRPVEGVAWLVLDREPEHPDDLLADLATWAPEYAAPAYPGSL